MESYVYNHKKWKESPWLTELFLFLISTSTNTEIHLTLEFGKKKVHLKTYPSVTYMLK